MKLWIVCPGVIIGWLRGAIYNIMLADSLLARGLSICEKESKKGMQEGGEGI